MLVLVLVLFFLNVRPTFRTSALVLCTKNVYIASYKYKVHFVRCSCECQFPGCEAGSAQDQLPEAATRLSKRWQADVFSCLLLSILQVLHTGSFLLGIVFVATTKFSTTVSRACNKAKTLAGLTYLHSYASAA